jgi:hypothetical protein
MTLEELTEEINMELKLIETTPFPALFDESLKADLTGFRKFRHVAHHGYGFLLDWGRLIMGIEKIENIYLRFKTRVSGNWQELV